jgi:hypothetical protein
MLGLLSLQEELLSGNSSPGFKSDQKNTKKCPELHKKLDEVLFSNVYKQLNNNGRLGE